MFTELKSLQEFKDAISEKRPTNSLVVIHFIATFSGQEIPPCKSIGAKMDDLVFACQDKHKFYKVNVDKNRDIALEAKVPAGVESVYPYFNFYANNQLKETVENSEGIDSITKIIETLSEEKVVFPPSPVVELKTLEEFKNVKNSDSISIVDFTATWCGPCRMIAPKFKTLARQTENISFYKVDVDENSEASQDAGVNCMPTFKFYQNGQELNSIEGADINAITSSIKQFSFLQVFPNLQSSHNIKLEKMEKSLNISHEVQDPDLPHSDSNIANVVLKSPEIKYFQIEVVQAGADDIIGVGFAQENYPLNGRMVGWSKTSCGYHGDDGTVFCNESHSNSKKFESFSKGDVVGCGIFGKNLYFTKNGKLQHTVENFVDGAVDVFPILSLSTNGLVKIKALSSEDAEPEKHKENSSSITEQLIEKLLTKN